MKLKVANHAGMAWRRRRTRILGRLVVYKTVDSLWRPAFNRYPGEIIGVVVHLGRRCVSWVWPIWVVDLRLTDEQFDRGSRALIDEEQSRGT